jgi:hypothetical protein
MLALVAAAAAYTSPIPIDSSTWFQGFGSHPEEGPFTLIASEVIVNPKGRVESCSAVTVLGDTNWARFTCELIRSRGRFHPAKIGDEPVYGIFRLRNAWVRSGYPPKDLPVWDVELTVSKAPDGVSLPRLKKLKFVVDPAGNMTSCGPAGDWNIQLAALACDELPKSLYAAAVRTPAGTATTSVQDITIRFAPAPN